jgi:small subunit ribosomal protein S17
VDANKEAMNSENLQEAAAPEAGGGEDQQAVTEEVRGKTEQAVGPGSDRSRPQVPPSTRRKRVLVGRVVSDRMQKTVVVLIERRKLHPLYKKYITRSKKVKAHDENNECRIGDLVRVVESRPISKDKRWRLAEILEKAK